MFFLSLVFNVVSSFQLICDECSLPHCTTCMPKQATTARALDTKRRCPNCRVLLSGNFTRHDLNKMFKLRDLKAFLERKQVSNETF